MHSSVRLLTRAFLLALSGVSVFAEAQKSEPSAKLARLRVSENQRYLVEENGRPFFYLGDTAWELFHRLDRAEADRYLEDRASKGFTVIQAVALAELDGLNDPNAYGHRPLLNNDPTKPDVKDGRENDYWDHVDYVIGKAESLGLRIGFLPSWGDKWQKAKWGIGPEIFNPENARIYGEWLGKRYKQAAIIWILGGDRPIETELERNIQRGFAAGVRAGDGGAHLITFHPNGQRGSAQAFHNEPWLDFNMRQNGHVAEYKSYAETLTDYRRLPVKPVMDAEPIYDDHPVSFNQNDFGHSVSADVRRPLYWDLFNGAFGHTYGHHSIWQMYSAKVKPTNTPVMTWSEALASPASAQMQHARWLLESRPYLTRIPDPLLVIEQEPATAWPGAGRYRFTATRDESGSYAMVYAPVGRTFKVRTELLSGTTLQAWWFNPRDGTAQSLGQFSKQPEQAFTPPTPGELLDWVLVLDDVAKNFPAPGNR
jgi:hypothetical protein